MGQVWLAQDTTLDEPRALKFVLPGLLSDANDATRLFYRKISHWRLSSPLATHSLF
jgi:hypothetical protein